MIRGNPLAGSKRFPMSDSLTVDSCLINRLSSVYFFLELVCCGLALGLFCFRADEAIQFGCGLIADWPANGKRPHCSVPSWVASRQEVGRFHSCASASSARVCRPQCRARIRWISSGFPVQDCHPSLTNHRQDPLLKVGFHPAFGWRRWGLEAFHRWTTIKASFNLCDSTAELDRFPPTTIP